MDKTFKEFLLDEGVRIVGFKELGDQSWKKGTGSRASQKGSVFPASDYIYSYQGKWVIDTKHAVEREAQRSNLTKPELEGFFRRMIDKHTNSGSGKGEYLYFSKSLNQGIVIDHRPDKRGKHKGNHFIIITVLPPGRKNPKPGTQKVIVEKEYLIESFDDEKFSEGFTDYMSELFSDHGTSKLNIFEAKFDGIQKDIILEDQKLTMILVDNKLWEMNIEVIEID